MPHTNRKVQGIWLVGIFPLMLWLFGSTQGRSAPHFITLFSENRTGNILALLAVSALTGGFARLCDRYHQWRISPLVGEMFAGFLLGPSLLGMFFPDALANIPHFSRIAHDLGWVGVLLMVQESGFSIDPARVRRSGLGVIVLGVVCVVVPFGSALLLGAITSLIRNEFGGNGSWGLLFFALFVSISGLVSALRVLREFRPLQADIRRTVIPAYALNELLGFVPLAILLAFTTPGADGVHASFVKLGIAAVFAGCSVAISSHTRRWFDRRQKSFAIANGLRPLVGIGCGLVTDYLGLTPLLGFFIGGTISGTPFERDNARSPEMKYSPFRLSMNFLVPIYFASIGLGLNIWENLNLGLTILVTVLAIGLRYGGALLGARLPPNRFGIGEQRLLGWLFTPAGVTGLVVAQVARSLGFFSEPLFTALVISVPVSVAILPWPLGRVIQELEDAQPLSARTLAPYILRPGVIEFSAPAKRVAEEDDASYIRRIIPLLCAAFARQIRLPVDFSTIASAMVGDGKGAPGIVNYGEGILLAHHQLKGLREPIVLLAKLSTPMDIQTHDTVEPQLIIFTLALAGTDGAERFGQQLWFQKQLGLTFHGHPERVHMLTSARTPTELYEAAQEAFQLHSRSN